MIAPKRRVMIAIGLALILSVVTVGIVLAASSVTVTYVPINPDCSYSRLEGYWGNDNPTADTHFYSENLTRGGTSHFVPFNDLVTSPGTSYFSQGTVINPTGTQANDIVRYTVSWQDDSLNVLASDSVTANCTTGEIITSKASKEESEPYTGIYLLSSAEQTPYLSVPNADGVMACGVFDVNGWGTKYVGLGDFPGCTAPVTVMCLTDTGEWTADNVSGVVMHGDWEVDFTSSQDGTCGLFSQ